MVLDFFKIVKNRRACHHFDPNGLISDEQINQLIELTMLTPSGYNIQPWEFVVIRDDKRKQELSEIAFGQKHVADAAAVVIVVGDLGFSKRAKEAVQHWVNAGLRNPDQAQSMYAALTKKHSQQQLREMTIRNVGLASMQLILIAEAMGFGTCPMMGFSKYKLQAFLGLPEDKIAGLMIAVGPKKPDVEDGPRLPRRSVKDVLHLESW